MLDAPAPSHEQLGHQQLAPPAIVAPAPREVSFGLVAGRAPLGTRRVLVHVGGRLAADRPLRGRSFSLHVPIVGEADVRVTAVDGRDRRSSTFVPSVRGLPRAAAPRPAAPRLDPVLAASLRAVRRRHGGTHGIYVQDLRTGRGAAWNAAARFPAASTLKLAIAVTALRAREGKPEVGSRLAVLLERMLVDSDNEAANELEAWIGGTVFAGSARIDETMRALGLRDSLMYGGYETPRRPAAPAPPIPIRVESAPAFGTGKYSTAADLARLARAVYLAAGGTGPLLRLGVSGSEARYLLWVLARVGDGGKLGRLLGPSVVLMHKAGWLQRARHDNGIVAFEEGAFVAAVLTWRSATADRLAGEVALVAVERFGR